MLDLIARLRSLPDNRQVWGLTSLHRLCLLAEDSFRSPWYAIVVAPNKTTYYIDYLLPTSQAPWPDARVCGEASSEEDAVKMILIAMDRCGGWSS